MLDVRRDDSKGCGCGFYVSEVRCWRCVGKANLRTTARVLKKNLRRAGRGLRGPSISVSKACEKPQWVTFNLAWRTFLIDSNWGGKHTWRNDTIQLIICTCYRRLRIPVIASCPGPAYERLPCFTSQTLTLCTSTDDSCTLTTRASDIHIGQLLLRWFVSFLDAVGL